MRGVAAVLLLFAGIALAAGDYAEVVPGERLAFPHDHGAHPEFRTEWWYVTGWLTTEEGKPLGFQVTFFRVRTRVGEDAQSSFAPTQLLFAHAALSDPQAGKLLHDERSARAGFGLAGAQVGRTEVWIDDWSLRQRDGAYVTRIATGDFAFELVLEPTQPLLLNGRNGWSRKAAQAKHASYYYSRPQLEVKGSVTRFGKSVEVSGSAWLDHEWSSAIMPEDAVGWDWIGINLADGGALMAFRMRDRQGRSLWAGGTWRRPDGTVRAFEPGEIVFEPARTWRSPRTGAMYPVEMRVRAGDLRFSLSPLLDDQELDSRGSVGAVYWEGAVSAMAQNQVAGRGYMELTGYLQRLRVELKVRWAPTTRFSGVPALLTGCTTSG